MKKLSNYPLLIVLSLLVPLLTACEQEDDVVDIFTGKTWYMTFIAAEGQNTMFDFWQGDQDARIKSFETIKGDNYTIQFDGANLDNSSVGGTFTARASSVNMSGTWNANGENRNLACDVTKSGTDSDKYLGKAFVNGLKSAYKYKGDNKNLYIYYKEGATIKFIAFAPQRN